MLIARHGKIVYFEAAGFRDRSVQAPMTKDAIFRIWAKPKNEMEPRLRLSLLPAGPGFWGLVNVFA
jgi:hypothetical protein